MSTGLFSKVRREEGQGLVEYALILLLVSVALVGGLTLLAGGLSNAFSFAVGRFPA
jgi:pilus assembly protein Flp/PilA